MPDLTFDLPDDVHTRLCELAKTGGIDAERLAHQILSVKVGCNTSSKDKPLSTVLLQQLPDGVLHLAESNPVYLRDPENREFVLLPYDQYTRILTPNTSAE